MSVLKKHPSRHRGIRLGITHKEKIQLSTLWTLWDTHAFARPAVKLLLAGYTLNLLEIPFQGLQYQTLHWLVKRAGNSADYRHYTVIKLHGTKGFLKSS